jgi:tetratricopeptide (TPR) repeat protein
LNRPVARQTRRIPAAPFLGLALAAATFAVFWRVAGFDFVNFDDPLLVTGNPHVRGALSLDGIRWAFTTLVVANWHPLTLVSHMLDVQLFGMNAGYHHVVNVAFHVVNALLLLHVLRRATGALWRSALVAALFALHPLHVESVAWIAERKDVLSTLFMMLTLLAYVRWVERPTAASYAWIVLAFAAGLMAKPMLVTVPCVLLLLDAWPLGRTRLVAGVRSRPVRSLRRLVAEKVPLFVLAAVSSAVTFAAQRAAGAVTVERYPLGLRLANAVIAAATYLLKTFWPLDLAVFYPYDPALAPWRVALATVALALISLLAVALVRRRPYLLVGWLWYLGTLVPVAGIVQVGNQAMADRYTYMPLIGVFLMVSWAAGDLAGAADAPDPGFRRRPRVLLVGAAGASVVVACAALSWRQVGHWRNSVTLFEHALAVTSRNALAHVQLAAALAEVGRGADAIVHYEETLRLAPDYALAHNSLGLELQKAGRLDEAIAHYEEAIRLAAEYPDAHYNLANALRAAGRSSEAAAHYREALRLDPRYAKAHNNLGDLLRAQGDPNGALAEFEAALGVEPELVDARINLATVLRVLGRNDDAIEQLATAVRLRPDSADVHYNLANALATRGDLGGAVAEYQRTVALKPDLAVAHNNLGLVLARQGKLDEAIAAFSAALQVDQGLALAWANRSRAYRERGDAERAEADLTRARALDPRHGG